MPATYLFQPRWFMGKHIDAEIKKLLIGKSLNFPCGQSSFGDVKADILPALNPDVIADLLNPYKTFKKFSFDSVFCDPPFAFYTNNKIGWKWIYKIASLARKRVIFKTPKIMIKLKRSLWKKYYIIIEDNRIGFTFLQVFDRTNKILE